MNEAFERMLDLAGQGYCCSQVVVQMALDLHGGENPDLIRAAGGFCRGYNSGGVCGLLLGGIMVLGYYLGGDPDAWAEDAFDPSLTEFTSWFALREETKAGITCSAILGGPSTSPADFGRCRNLLMAVWEKLYGLLSQSGLDLTQPPNQQETV